MQIWDWILFNKDWLFSGAGIVVLVYVGKLLFNAFIEPKSNGIRDSGVPNAKMSRLKPERPEGDKLEPLIVRLADGNLYQIQVLFSYRVTNPLALITGAGEMGKAEKMLINSLKVRLIQELEPIDVDDLRRRRREIGANILSSMKDIENKIGLAFVELEIGAISKKKKAYV